MLSDYRRYLVNIRNSMIQCGVGIEVNKVEGYDEIFYLGEKLDSLLWFYSVLKIGGSGDSLRGFIFPLNSFYMSRIRDKYFEDYLLYKAGYMEISASDTIARLNKAREKKEYESNLVVEENYKEDTEVAGIPVYDEDGFVVYTTDGSLDNTSAIKEVADDDFIVQDTEESDDFSSWGSDDDDFVTQDSEEVEEVEDDDFINWGDNSEEESDEDDFGTWGSDEDDDFVEQVTDDSEDDFNSWGSDIEDGEFVEQDVEESEDDFGTWGGNEDELEDDFGSWGNGEESEDSEGYSDEDDFGTWGSSEEEFESVEESDEDAFDSWGNEEESEDDFSSWGSSEEEFESVEESDEDAFGSWGSNEEELEDESEYDDDFGSWGKGLSESEESSGSGVTGYGGTPKSVENVTNTTKTKFDYDMESNEKTAETIEKIGTALFSKGSLIKTKVTEKLKNVSD